MPYFKKRHFLRDSINSVLKQTHHNFEILLIDDEASEESLNYLEEIRNYDVMHGIEEDIALLSLWPISYLNPERVPKATDSKD